MCDVYLESLRQQLYFLRKMAKEFIRMALIYAKQMRTSSEQ